VAQEGVVPGESAGAVVIAEVAGIPTGVGVDSEVLAVSVDAWIAELDGVSGVSGCEYGSVSLVLKDRGILDVGLVRLIHAYREACGACRLSVYQGRHG